MVEIAIHYKSKLNTYTVYHCRTQLTLSSVRFIGGPKHYLLEGQRPSRVVEDCILYFRGRLITGREREEGERRKRHVRGDDDDLTL